MFRTIFSVALIGAANAVSLTGEKVSNKLDLEEVFAKAQSGDYTSDDVENLMEHVDKAMKGKDVTDAIDWAAEKGIGFDEVKAAIEGAEVAGAFDKHDIYDFAMDACCHFQVGEGDLDEMLHYAGKKLGITAEQGQELLETAGEAFDISEEEFQQAIKDCHDVGAKCAAKAKEGGDKKKKGGEKKEAKDSKLAQKADLLEQVKNVDLEKVTPKDVADFLKENGDELLKQLKKNQVEVVAFVKKNADKIEEFVSENMEELKEFAAELEKHLGDIDWDEVKAKAEAFFKEGEAKLAKKAKKAKKGKGKKEAKE